MCTLTRVHSVVLRVLVGGASILATSLTLRASDGPIAHWSFEEGAGTTAFDSAGSHNGVISGASYIAAPAPVGGGALALDFDGVDDRVSVPHSADLSFQANVSSFTVAAWIKTSDADDGRIVEKKSGTGSGYTFNTATSGQVEFILEGAGETVSGASGGFVIDGIYHHVAGVHAADAQEVLLYVDGVLVDSRSTGGVVGLIGGSASLEIGSRPGFGPSPILEFKGTIDEVKIFSRALGASEIASEAGLRVPFSEFVVEEVEIEFRDFPSGRDAFEVEGRFSLDAETDGVDPTTEEVVLTVGTATITINPGLIKEKESGEFEFEGVVDGVELDLEIEEASVDRFVFKAEATDTDLLGTVNPLRIALTIGNETGETIVPLVGSLESDEG